jgi:predicted Zn-dependent protease with MMP-like domain
MNEVRIDPQEILEKLSLEEDRKKISLYLSRTVYERFKSACGSAPASRVMEELMKEFIVGVKRSKKSREK